MRHRNGQWGEKTHTERQHILRIWYSPSGQTTRAQRSPRQAHKAPFCTINTHLSCRRLKRKGQHFLHLSSCIGCIGLFRRSPWRNVTPAAPSTATRLRREPCGLLPRQSFECPSSQPHFDLSSRCQLAAMFVYPAREATCVITSNEVTCFDLSWNLILGRDKDVEMGLRLRIWKCESVWGWDYLSSFWGGKRGFANEIWEFKLWLKVCLMSSSPPPPHARAHLFSSSPIVRFFSSHVNVLYMHKRAKQSLVDSKCSPSHEDYRQLLLLQII